MPLRESIQIPMARNPARTPRLIVRCLAHLCLHLREVHDRCPDVLVWRPRCMPRGLTILNLAYAGFQIIQREIAHLILETCEIHIGGGGGSSLVLTTLWLQWQLIMERGGPSNRQGYAGSLGTCTALRGTTTTTAHSKLCES